MNLLNNLCYFFIRTFEEDVCMKLKSLVLTIFLSLSLLTCTESPLSTGRYKQFDSETCNSNIERRTANINELENIDRSNAHNYKITGTCERDKSEVRVYVEGHPLDKQPICSRGEWEIAADVTGIVNKKKRVQVAVSQAGSSGLLCKNVTNYFICPNGYVGVPQLDNFTNENFCVMKYEAKVKSEKDLPTLSRRQIIKAEALARGALIQRVNTEDAIKYCKENGAGYDLINNDEWQTIARNIEQEPVNWSNEDLKIGNENRLNIGNVSGGATGDSNDNDINDKRWDYHKRTHKLTNTEYIWDFSGNLAEVVQHDISNLSTTYTGYIYKIPNALKELFGPDKDYTILDDRERLRGFAGLGYMQGNRFEGGIIRGGNNSRTAGIFSVDTTINTSRQDFRPSIGFRCVYHP